MGNVKGSSLLLLARTFAKNLLVARPTLEKKEREFCRCAQDERLMCGVRKWKTFLDVAMTRRVEWKDAGL